MADINDFHRGDTKTYKFTFTAAGSPIDITGYVIWLTLKSDKSLADNAAEMQVVATAGDHALDDEVNGIMYVEATSEDTEVVPETYFYDFQRVIDGAPPKVRTLQSGKVKVLEDVTRENA